VELALWQVGENLEVEFILFFPFHFCPYFFDEIRNKHLQPSTHIAAHLQVPTHKPMLQHAKELFSSSAPSDNDAFAIKMNSISNKNF